MILRARYVNRKKEKRIIFFSFGRNWKNLWKINIWIWLILNLQLSIECFNSCKNDKCRTKFQYFKNFTFMRGITFFQKNNSELRIIQICIRISRKFLISIYSKNQVKKIVFFLDLFFHVESRFTRLYHTKQIPFCLPRIRIYIHISACIYTECLKMR